MTSLASLRQLFSDNGPEKSNLSRTRAEPGQIEAHEPVPAAEWRATLAWRLVSFLPFAVAIVLDLIAPRSFPPMFAMPPDVLGIPFGVVLQAVILLWAALGAAVVWQTRRPFVAVLALFVCIAPSIVALVLSPAITLIVLNS